MYGVVDELGILKDDEVYINLCERSGVLESKVIVTRFAFSPPSQCLRFVAEAHFQGIRATNHRASSNFADAANS